MRRNGHTLYQFATHEENGIPPSYAQQGAWDYGRLNHLPLWPEFIIFSTWKDYSKRFPNSFIYTLEIPLRGRLQITHHEVTRVVAPGYAYVIPVGDGGIMRTLPGEECWKFCCGICGECAESFFSRFSPSGGLLPLSDTERICRWGDRVMRLLLEKRKESVPEIAGLAAEFLTWLLEQRRGSNALPFEISNALRIFGASGPDNPPYTELEILSPLAEIPPGGSAGFEYFLGGCEVAKGESVHSVSGECAVTARLQKDGDGGFKFSAGFFKEGEIEIAAFSETSETPLLRKKCYPVSPVCARGEIPRGARLLTAKFFDNSGNPSTIDTIKL